jgi:hypothetical protein
MLTSKSWCWSRLGAQLDGIPIKKCPGAARTARGVARKGRTFPCKMRLAGCPLRTRSGQRKESSVCQRRAPNAWARLVLRDVESSWASPGAPDARPRPRLTCRQAPELAQRSRSGLSMRGAATMARAPAFRPKHAPERAEERRPLGHRSGTLAREVSVRSQHGGAMRYAAHPEWSEVPTHEPVAHRPQCRFRSTLRRKCLERAGALCMGW